MADFALRVNGSERKVNVAPDTPMLWVLRDTLAMTGTKFGCGAGLCGACTVLVDGEARRSCQTLVSQAVGKQITTIEGLGTASGAAGCIRYNRLGLMKKFRSAAIARWGRSCRRRSCWPRRPILPTTRLRTRWTGICVAAGPIIGSGRRFIGRLVG